MRRAGVIMVLGVFGWAAWTLGEARAQGRVPRQSQILSGTYLDPAIQRQDILPGVIIQSIPEYRRVYNRPRYSTGAFLFRFEPSSQEAMAWESNVRNGNYRNHRGGTIPMYYYPKPWEVLNSRARPDFDRNPEAFDRSQEGETLMELVEPARASK